MQAGILSFYKHLRSLSEIKEAFLKIIGTLLLSYFNEKRGSNNFEIFGPISKIKAGIQIQLPFTANLVQAPNIETMSYLRQFDAFCNHSVQYCMTRLTSDPMGERSKGGPIILLPTVDLALQSWLHLFSMLLKVKLFQDLHKIPFWHANLLVSI